MSLAIPVKTFPAPAGAPLIALPNLKLRWIIDHVPASTWALVMFTLGRHRVLQALLNRIEWLEPIQQNVFGAKNKTALALVAYRAI